MRNVEGGEPGPRPDLRLWRGLRRQQPPAWTIWPGENHGQSEYVRPNEDIEDRVSRLYQSIESPVMTGVQLEFALRRRKPEEGSPSTASIPRTRSTCSPASNWWSWAATRSPATRRWSSAARSWPAAEFDFPARLVEKSPDETYGFIEKLWAVRRVGEIIDEMDLQGKNEELVKELVDSRPAHGILTPYTLVLRRRQHQYPIRPGEPAAGGRSPGALNQVDGVSGFVQRTISSNFRRPTRPWRPKTAGKMFAARSAGGSYGYGGQSYGGMGGRGGGSSPGAGMPSAAPTPEPALSGFGGRGSGHRARSAGSSASQGQMPAPSAKGRPSEFFMGATGKVADEEIAKAEQTIRTVGNRAFLPSQRAVDRLYVDRGPARRTPPESSSSAKSTSTWPNATATRSRSTSSSMSPS